MVSNEVYNSRYYGANGALVTKAGWYSTEEGWVYVNNNGFVANNGIFLIGGKEYVFQYGYWVG